MRVFTVTVAKSGIFGRKRLTPAIDSRIRSALSQPPWLVRDDDRQETWVSASGIVRMDVITNEPSSTGALIQRFPSGNAATWTGHIDDLQFVADNPDPGRVADLPGAFALVTASDEAANAYTSVHRVEPLYVAEGRDVRVISTSARIAHEVAGTPNGAPPTDAVLGLSGAGYMINDLTPFAGVRAVPAECQVTVTASRSRFSPLPRPDIDPTTPIDQVADMLAEALVAAATAAVRGGTRPTAHLTGGKDSRLAVAALSAAGIDFTALTSGPESHPDVVIARRLAAKLGVEHVVRPQAGTAAGGDVVVAQPVRRAFNALRGCEGMISCYESIFINGRYRVNSTTVGGHGGELLRGGFTLALPPAAPTTLADRLQKRLAPHSFLLTPAARNRLEEITSPWIMALGKDPYRASEELYRTLRTGRWHAVARAIYTINGPRRSVLADNQAVRIASAADQEAVAQERLVHATLHKLRPDLCSIPLGAKRWYFERSGPTPLCDPDHWKDRAPLPHAKTTAWDWRQRYTNELHNHFMETILSAPLYGWLLDRGSTERFLSEGLGDSRGALHVRLAWSLYTVSQLLNGLGNMSTEPQGPVFTIAVPEVIRKSPG